MHDFAFFRFDPSKVKHMELVELPLAPAEAELAAEIVIIGNNAGGKAGTSAGFFLPLDRAARALALLQADEPVPRGTLQAVCLHQPFDEASRLGLPADTEAELRARQPSLRGVLVLSELLPEGPAAAALEVGDLSLIHI